MPNELVAKCTVGFYQIETLRLVDGLGNIGVKSTSLAGTPIAVKYEWLSAGECFRLLHASIPSLLALNLKGSQRVVTMSGLISKSALLAMRNC